MNKVEDEGAVELALAEQRSMDQRLAPDFHSLLGRPRRRTRPSLGPPALALAALLVAAGVGLWSRSRTAMSSSSPGRRHASATASLENWKAPTDFLLKTPGSRLWTTSPSFGSFETGNPLSPVERKKGSKS